MGEYDKKKAVALKICGKGWKFMQAKILRGSMVSFRIIITLFGLALGTAGASLTLETVSYAGAPLVGIGLCCSALPWISHPSKRIEWGMRAALLLFIVMVMWIQGMFSLSLWRMLLSVLF